MKIAVFGTGYVGLVTGLCFAEMGIDVHCVDINQEKIDQLNQGISPIFEPGIETLIATNLKSKRIHFTTDAITAIHRAEVIFIAVGTPSDVDGSADLKYVLEVAETIAKNMNGDKIIVNKSTVPVGTGYKVKELVANVLRQRSVKYEFDVVSNPEFLREGAALEDCLKPSRVVVGCESEKAKELMSQIYEPFLKNGNPLIFMDLLSSEMTKYAANAMLATKISLMNEFSRLCEKVGADIENVRKGIGSDFRIGPHFIFAGIGYGGSCFPKDVRALIKTGLDQNEKLEILTAVENTNHLQREKFFKKVIQNLPSKEKNQRIAVWGVSFKPGTDDIREAPALDMIQGLLDQGFQVTVYDPVAADNAKTYFKNNPALTFMDDQYLVLEGASALVIVTEWKSFKEPDFERMQSIMKHPIIFDGRNIYLSKPIQKTKFQYHSIGRPAVVARA
ncbi:MAG: UDP-glucose/GDP-mannose dehydrogenase family protein [Pseudobdellovibrionaceae bacterium]